MSLYPNLYLKDVTKINKEILKQYQIKGLLLDVDNTLLDFDKKLLQGIEPWIEEMKKSKIKMCILSNSNKKEKVEMVAKKLDLPYIFLAMKPFRKGFKKGKEILQLDNENIAVVGDQIFTDVIGANRNQMISILVEPIAEKDIFITKIKRPLENKIIQRFKEKNEEESKDKK